jgi:iron complex outermembrane receptor protein
MFQKPSFLRAAAAACVISTSPFLATNAQEADEETIDELVVRAHPLSSETLAQPVATLSGDELDRAVSSSIAETLREVPGVHNASFGQAVGRPVIRGLGGARVKTMEDRIDSMDVSVSSPDHLTTIEPFTAQSIEVLKGPTTLLYGTGAIGGVVDVHTGRVPHEIPEKLSATADLRATDNADQRSAAVRLNAGAGSFAFHADAFYRDADEYDIPGYAESAALRELEEMEHEGEEEHEEGEHDEHGEAFGTLENSQVSTQGGAVGMSYIGDRGFIGLSVSTYDAEYGLPGHSHEHGEEEEPGAAEEEEEGGAFLDLDQIRVDIEGGLIAPFAGFTNLNFRLGFNDYEHTEFEGNGEAGTVFANEALEGRLELVHEAGSNYEGATGIQVSTREFSALGEEAFVQPVDTQSVGVFYVGQRRFDSTGLEFGVRYERVEHDPTSPSPSRGFDLGAASLGLTVPLSDYWTISGTFDYSNRAPVAEELYSDGPHLVTESYEIGDPDLNEEQASNVSATLEYDRESLYFTLSAYYTDFGDFIYEFATGEEIDELPVLQWQQGDATFQGFEADFGWRALDWGDGTLELNAGYDYVRARLDSGANRNLPRIPPQRWRVGALMKLRNMLAEVSWGQVSAQKDTAEGELPTDSYDDLRIHLGYGMDLGSSRLEIFVAGRNLTDDEIRYHTSYIKDVAPQRGRTIEAGVILRL